MKLEFLASLSHTLIKLPNELLEYFKQIIGFEFLFKMHNVTKMVQKKKKKQVKFAKIL